MGATLQTSVLLPRIHLDPSTLSVTTGAPVTSWIQVAKTGKFRASRYGPFEISTQMLAEMVANSRTTTTREPVDYDHLSEEPINPEDGKAAGWFLELQLRNNGEELWGLVEWTPRAVELIRNKEYQYVSPSFVTKYTTKEEGKQVGAKLLAAAITNRPFLENMAPLKLSNLVTLSDTSMTERQARVAQAVYDKYSATFDDGGAYIVEFFDDYVVVRRDGKLFRLDYALSDDLAVSFPSDPLEVVIQYSPINTLSDSAAGDESGGQNTMPDIKPTDSQDIISLRASLDTLNSTVTELRSDLDQERTLRQAAELELRGDRANSKVAKLLSEGKLSKKQEDWAKKYALSNPEEFDTYASTLVPIRELGKVHGSGEDDKHITDGDDVVKTFSDKVAAHISANGGREKVRYGDAMRAVTTENPELAEKYRAAMAQFTTN